jgi:hypothetical protein
LDLLALAGSTGSDVNDRNIAKSGALGLDALFTASEVSCRANTLNKSSKSSKFLPIFYLERSRCIDAFLTDIFARMKTIFAFVDIDTFSLKKSTKWKNRQPNL